MKNYKELGANIKGGFYRGMIDCMGTMHSIFALSDKSLAEHLYH